MPEKSLMFCGWELEALTKLLGEMTVRQFKALGLDELEVELITGVYRALAEEFPNV